jgi:hypothetical protein
VALIAPRIIMACAEEQGQKTEQAGVVSILQCP